MDKFTKYTAFLESLKTDDNSDSIDIVKEAFTAIYESYADVVEYDQGDALTRFNDKASELARSMGNNMPNFLKQSSERNQRDYTFTDDTSDAQSAYSSTVDVIIGGESNEDVFSEFKQELEKEQQYQKQNDSLGFNLPHEINDII